MIEPPLIYAFKPINKFTRSKLERMGGKCNGCGHHFPIILFLEEKEKKKSVCGMNGLINWHSAALVILNKCSSFLSQIQPKK